MLNPSFNQDFNFSKNNIDIKELNAFMNDKKKKLEKELTKYDVDKDTQAKALNVQHLAQMPKYLPLFTKKIKDPKAMKKQKATKDLDYTRKKGQPREEYHEHPIEANKEFDMAQVELEEDKQIEGLQYEVEIRPMSIDPSVFITPQQPQQESILSTKKYRPSPQQSKSPNRYDPKSPLKISEEQMGKLNLVERENYQLRAEVEHKRLEYEKINFKYAKAQSQFIEIMRELSRFRDEFNDQYSIQSKLKKVQGVTGTITELLSIKDRILATEESQLQKFKNQASKLFEQDSPSSKQATMSRRRSSVAMKALSQKELGLTLTQTFCKINKDTGSRVLKINNIRTIVNYAINKQKAECTFTFYTQVSHEPLQYTFTRITEKFDPWKESTKFSFKTILGDLKLELVEKPEAKYLEYNHEESLYYKVSNTMIKYVHASPCRLNTLSITHMEGKQGLALTVNEKEFNRQQCTVEVSEEKVMKEVISVHVQNGHYEDEIMAIMYKSDIVEGLIGKYVKRLLQMGEFDINPLSPSTSLFTKQRSSLLANSVNRYARLSIFDREAKGLKVRRKTFIGVRISNASLGSYNNQTMNTSTHRESNRRSSSVTQSQTMKNSSYFITSFEKMKDAVIYHIQKKKDQEKSALNSHLALPQLTQQVSDDRKVTPAAMVARLSLTSASAKENKMGQIMKLIYANSMYVTVHFELYVVEREDFPVYLELVHNTDDDSILLFIVQDPKSLQVQEVHLDSLDNQNWLLIKERFGESSEQLISNIETIFRTLEFLSIIKQLTSRSQSKLQQELGIPQSNKKMKEMPPRDMLVSQEMNLGSMKIKIN